MTERLRHPYTEGWATVFHGGFAAWFALGIALCTLGVWAHTVATARHFADYKKGIHQQ